MTTPPPTQQVLPERHGLGKMMLGAILHGKPCRSKFEVAFGPYPEGALGYVWEVHCLKRRWHFGLHRAGWVILDERYGKEPGPGSRPVTFFARWDEANTGSVLVVYGEHHGRVHRRVMEAGLR